MYCARNGSPGINTVSAKSPGAAFICLVAMDYSFLLRPETIPRTLTDYQRHPHGIRGKLALSCVALGLAACSPPADETATPSTSRAQLVVAGQLQSDELVEAS